MIKRFIRLVHNLYKSQKLYKAIMTDTVPEKMDSKSVYIIHNEGYYWQAVMVCPCGCKNILQMNLMEDYNPSWKFIINNKNVITLHPSVNRTVGCSSHFFIRRGKIVWCS
jgi:hypothetical protein